MDRNLQSEVADVVNFLMPRDHVPLPLQLRRLVLELAGLLHVGRRSLVWYRCF